VTDYGKIKKEKSMSSNGKIAKLMDKVFMSLKKVNIKVKMYLFRPFSSVYKTRIRNIKFFKRRYLSRFLLKW